MGGKPSKSTPKDMRLKANNPNAGKPKQPAMPMKKPIVPPPPKKGS